MVGTQGCGRKRSWPTSIYNRSIYREVWRRHRKTPVRTTGTSQPRFETSATKYKSRALSLHEVGRGGFWRAAYKNFYHL